MRLVLWNLRHRRGRHVLNIFVIALTAAVLIVFTSVVTQLIRESRRAHSAVYARINFETKVGGDDILFPLAFERMFSEIEGVKWAEPYTLIPVKGEGDIALYAVKETWTKHPDSFFRIEPDAVEAWKRDAPNGMVASAEAAKLLNLQPGKLVELPTESGPIQFKVSAIGPPLGGPNILVHFDYVHQRSMDPGQAYFWVYTAAADFAKVAQTLEERLAQTGYYVTAMSETQFHLIMVEQAAAIPIFFGFLGLFLIITAALTLANNSAISIRERRAELATLRVIGFKGRSLMFSLLAELAIVGILGGTLAALMLKVLFGAGVSVASDSPIMEATRIGWPHIAIGLAVSILLPAIGALPSALLSLRKPLAAALRDAA
jgi:hypothetical protein